VTSRAAYPHEREADVVLRDGTTGAMLSASDVTVDAPFARSYSRWRPPAWS
jgi:hypothetical protein